MDASVIRSAIVGRLALAPGVLISLDRAAQTATMACCCKLMWIFHTVQVLSHYLPVQDDALDAFRCVAAGVMVAGDLMLKTNVATAWVATATARPQKIVRMRACYFTFHKHTCQAPPLGVQAFAVHT